MSWVMDKAALREAFGGPQAGPIAHHLIPDDLLDGRLRDFAPFKTPGDHGDLARAKAEMTKSKYATRRGCLRRQRLQGRLPRRRRTPTGRAPGAHDAGDQGAGAKLGIKFRVGGRGGGSGRPRRRARSLAGGWWYADYPEPRTSSIPCSRARRSCRSGAPTPRSSGSPRRRRPGSVSGAASGACRASTPTSSGAARSPAPAPRLLRAARPEAQHRDRGRDPVPVAKPDHDPRAAGRKWGFDQSTGMTAFAHVAVKR